MSFTPVRLSQRDPRWKDDKLGSSSYTLGTSGCAVSSVAMFLSGFGYNETPGSLNAKLKNSGGFMDAAIVWGAVSTIQPKVKFKNIVICRDSDAPLAQINAALAKGQPVLAEVDYSPAAGLQTHWVVIYARQDNDYLILDPWPYPVDNGNSLLMPHYSHGKPLNRTITAVVWYEAQETQVSAPPGNTPSPTGASMIVRVMDGLDAGLRLRSAATTNSDTVALEASGTLLAVLEPLDVASPKIGVFDQWLRVRDPQGFEGYVAAWYVEKTGSTPPAPVTPPPATPTPVGVAAPQSVVDAVNALRASKGLPAYKANATLAQIAQKHADWMASSGRVEHLNADGKRPFQRAVDAGYPLAGDLTQGGFMSENIFAGQNSSTNDAMTMWQGDNAHLNTMLSPNYGECGAGVAIVNGVVYFCFDAAKPKTAVPVTPPVEPPPATPPVTPPVPPPATPPATPAEPALSVFVSQDVGSSGLRLRATPSSGGTLIKILKAGRELIALEPANAAKAKVGKQDQWLKVRDISGEEGYVAAWMVVLTAGSVNVTPPQPPIVTPPPATPPVTPPPVTPPAPPVSEFVVQVSAAVGSSGLRLRKIANSAGLLVAIESVGTKLAVLESANVAKGKIGKQNQWLNVRDPQGKTGYVAAWFVELPKQAAAPGLVSFDVSDFTETEVVTVHVSGLVTSYGGLNLRAAPTLGAKILSVLPAYLPLELLDPAEIEKVGQFNIWIHVRTPEGTEGYVGAWYVEKS